MTDKFRPRTAADENTRLLLVTLVGLTFVMNAIGRGIPESFAVYLLPVEAALHVDRSRIALTYAINMLAYAAAAPLVGHVIDRFGARACYLLGLASMGAGSLLAAHVSSIWQYYIAVGMFGGLASACLSMVAASSLLSRWFLSGMGFMSAIPYAAAGVGMLIFPPLAQALMRTHDWRQVVTWQGLFVLGVVPLVAVLPLGRMSAGSVTWQAMRAERGAQASSSSPAAWTFGEAVRSSAFWLMFLAYFLTSVAAYAVLPHSVAYLVERGFDPVVAASAFGSTGLLSMCGILFTGWLADRVGRQLIGAISYVVTITGIACLIGISRTPSVLLLYGFVLCFGLMQGARGPILVAMMTKMFRGGPVGTIFGFMSMALGLGAATGSWMSGLSRSLYGSYVPSFACAALAAASAMAVFLLPSLRREQAVRRPRASGAYSGGRHI